jgi:WD40 repeat protein
LVNLRKVIRRSTHILTQDKTQLIGQLFGHLALQKSPAIQILLDTAAKYVSGPWLRPLGPSLVPPNQLVLQTLTGHEDEVRGVAITPDGQCAISIEREKLIVWDIDRAIPRLTLKSCDEDDLGFQEITITSEGQRIIIRDGYLIKVLDINSGTELFSLKDDTYPLSLEVTSNRYEIDTNSIGNFPFGKLDQGNEILIQHINKLPGTTMAVYNASGALFAIRVLENHDLTVMNVTSGEILFNLKGHNDQVASVRVSSDGQRAISASIDCTLKVWDLHQGILLYDLKGHSGMVDPVAMTPDGQRGVSASGNTLKVWDLERGVELSTLIGHTSSIQSVAITPDGRRVISGALDGIIKIWDLETAEDQSMLAQNEDYSSHHRGAVTSLVVTPDGELAISVSVDETITIWLLEKAIPVQTRQLPYEGVPMMTWRIHKQWKIPHFYYHDSGFIPFYGLTSVAITPDMRYIIAASADKRLKVIALSSRLDFVDLITESIDIKGQLLTGHRDSVWTIAVTPNSRRVISGSDDRTVKVWDLKQAKELYTLEHPDHVIAIAVTPDGRHIISATRSEVYKWNLRSKKR